MRLHIICDGTPLGTQILDADTGEELDLPVHGVHIELEATKQPVVMLLLRGPIKLDVTGPLVQLQPETIRRIRAGCA